MQPSGEHKPHLVEVATHEAEPFVELGPHS
jgi:hypothetical protein